MGLNGRDRAAGVTAGRVFNGCLLCTGFNAADMDVGSHRKFGASQVHVYGSYM